MINTRGLLVVLLTSLGSMTLGWTQADRAWRADVHTGMLCKGDRLK